MLMAQSARIQRRHTRGAVRRRRPHPRGPVGEPGVAVRAPREQMGAQVDLDSLASHWQRALDAAESALRAAAESLPAHELALREHDLVSERQRAAATLAAVARSAGARTTPWLSPVPVTRAMLGLHAEVQACLFDLDGVLTDSEVLHAQAWAAVFDEFLMKVAERAGRHFIHFDSRADYRAYIDGRPRLEGVHAFLASRGIALPEGRPSDGAHAETAYGLATRKGEILAGQLRRSGVSALPGARRYLQATGYAGVSRGVISASANTQSMLELAELASLAEGSVDADVIRTGGLRSRPAPDVLLAACRDLGVAPENAVTFTHSAAGVAAGHAAGMAVIGVGSGAQGVLLSGFGAEQVVSGLNVLLDRRLVDGFARSSA